MGHLKVFESHIGYRRIVIGLSEGVGLDTRFGLFGPTVSLCDVDLIDGVGDRDRHGILTGDEELLRQFDAGMEVGPWLDWLAERHPEFEWAATLYGRLMAEMGA
jgi:hypothetical protein